MVRWKYYIIRSRKLGSFNYSSKEMDEDTIILETYDKRRLRKHLKPFVKLKNKCGFAEYKKPLETEEQKFNHLNSFNEVQRNEILKTICYYQEDCDVKDPIDIFGWFNTLDIDKRKELLLKHMSSYYIKVITIPEGYGKMTKDTENEFIESISKSCIVDLIYDIDEEEGFEDILYESDKQCDTEHMDTVDSELNEHVPHDEWCDYKNEFTEDYFDGLISKSWKKEDKNKTDPFEIKRLINCSKTFRTGMGFLFYDWLYKK